MKKFLLFLFLAYTTILIAQVNYIPKGDTDKISLTIDSVVYLSKEKSLVKLNITFGNLLNDTVKLSNIEHIISPRYLFPSPENYCYSSSTRMTFMIKESADSNTYNIEVNGLSIGSSLELAKIVNKKEGYDDNYYEILSIPPKEKVSLSVYPNLIYDDLYGKEFYITLVYSYKYNIINTPSLLSNNNTVNNKLKKESICVISNEVKINLTHCNDN